MPTLAPGTHAHRRPAASKPVRNVSLSAPVHAPPLLCPSRCLCSCLTKVDKCANDSIEYSIQSPHSLLRRLSVPADGQVTYALLGHFGLPHLLLLGHEERVLDALIGAADEDVGAVRVGAAHPASGCSVVAVTASVCVHLHGSLVAAAILRQHVVGHGNVHGGAGRDSAHGAEATEAGERRSPALRESGGHCYPMAQTRRRGEGNATKQRATESRNERGADGSASDTVTNLPPRGIQKWHERQNCITTGIQSWNDDVRIGIERTVARDRFLTRKVGRPSGKFPFI